MAVEPNEEWISLLLDSESGASPLDEVDARFAEVEPNLEHDLTLYHQTLSTSSAFGSHSPGPYDEEGYVDAAAALHEISLPSLASLLADSEQCSTGHKLLATQQLDSEDLSSVHPQELQHPVVQLGPPSPTQHQHQKPGHASPTTTGSGATKSLGQDKATDNSASRSGSLSPSGCLPMPSSSETNTRACTPTSSLEQHAAPIAATGTACSADSQGTAAPAPTPPANSDSGTGSDNEPTSAHPAAGADEEQKRQARMLRNRESASLSRQRKKMQLEEVQRRCLELQTQNTHLTGIVARLTQENGMLRQQLAAVCQRTNSPPMMPPGMPVGVPSPGLAGQPPVPNAGPGCLPMPFLPMPGMPLPPYGMPYPGIPAPKLPIQKLNPIRPAKAAKPKRQQQQQQHLASHQSQLKSKAPAALGPASAEDSIAGAAGSARKRIRTIAGASTAMMAVLCFVAICSPMAPLLSSKLSSSGINSANVLPASWHHSGRVLMSLPDSNSSLESQLPDGFADGFAGRGLGAYGNQTPAAAYANASSEYPSFDNATQLSSLLPQLNDKRHELQALQELKELAPVAVFADWSSSSTPRHNWAHGLPQIAKRTTTLQLPSLIPPVRCENEFRFDASSVDNPAQARAAVQRYLSSLGPVNPLGRRNPGVLPLPPIGGVFEETGGTSTNKQEKDVNGDGHRAKIGCDEDEGDIVVSVMLPAEQPADGTLTQLDRLYVVVVKPGRQFNTYSCHLPQPVLV